MLWELYFADRKQIPLLLLHARGAAPWCPEWYKTLQSVTAKCSVAPYGKMPSPVSLCPPHLVQERNMLVQSCSAEHCDQQCRM